MTQVMSLFQGFGQNIQQTFGMRRQQQPEYLVTPAPAAGAAGDAPAGSGSLLIDLMNRARQLNGTALVTAVRGRVDQMADNNVVIMRLSNLLTGLNRTRRQTEAEPAVADVKPEEAAPVDSKPTETIDDVVKRLKEEREQSLGSGPVAPTGHTGPNIIPRAIDGVAHIPGKLFEGLDGLLGVGSLSGQGMSSVLDQFTKMIASNGGNVTVARAESHYSESPRPESRRRSLWDRFEERRRVWDERVRERMERRRNGRRSHDEPVVKPGLPLDPEPAADAIDHMV